MDMLCLCLGDSLQICRRGLYFYLVLVMVTVLPAVCIGFDLPQCSNGWINVDETATENFICNGMFNDNVTWVVRDTVNSVDVILGYCELSCTCYSSFAGVSSITRELNRTGLSIKANQRATFSGKTLVCTGNSGKADCALNFIRTAVLGQCTVGFTVDWKVTGSCQIEKVFSSREKYSCSWYTSQVNQKESSTLIAQPFFEKSSFLEYGLQYYRGNCNFTESFPTQNGVYAYFFQFEPGPSGGWNHTLKIEPPGVPSIKNCPLYVAEGSTLYCDCTTTGPGDPPAVSSWGADSQSYQLRLDNVLRDQNGSEYTCSQTWGRGLQNTKYTLHVAYGPEDKDLSISGPFPFTTDGNLTLTLSCQASNTNPTPQYTWTGVTCNEGDSDSTCSFTPRVPEDDGQVVTCTATNNGMSTDIKTATASYNVTVNYPPSKIVITGYNSRKLLIAGDSDSLTCTVSGGKPPVTGINFYCKRKDDTRINGTLNPSSSSSTVNIDVFQVGDNGTGCACDTSGFWPANLNHSLEASVRLTVEAAQPPTVNSVTLRNSTSPLTISASDRESVRLACSARGLPRPSISVVREDTGQKLEANVSLFLTQDVIIQHYNLTTSARCQDAAVYTCNASNRAGMDEKNITLFVNCAPQYENKTTQLFIETGPEKSQSLTIDIIAYPKPTFKEAVFSVNTSSVNASTVDARTRATFNSTCVKTNFIYKFRCTIFVIISRAGDSGTNYNITLENSFGEISFTVELSVTSETHTKASISDKNTFPVAAVAGGVGGGVGLLLIIVIVVVIVRVTRRRKDSQKQIQDSPTSADSEDKRHSQNMSASVLTLLEEHINSMYMSSHASKPSASKPSRNSLGLSPSSHTKNKEERKDDNDVDDGNNNAGEDDTSFSYASVASGKRPVIAHPFFPVTTDSADQSSDYTYVDVDVKPQNGAANSTGILFGPANSNMTDFSSDYADVDGYSSVETTRLNTPTASVTGRSSPMNRDPVHFSSAYSDADGYSSVRVSGPGIGGTVKKPEDRVDEYAVVNRNQGWNPAFDRSDEYDHINQQATAVSQDVYAQVVKSSKQKAQGIVPNTDIDQKTEPEPDPYAHVQKPKPATKPKPQQTTDATNSPASSANYEDIDGLQQEVTQTAMTQEADLTVNQESEQEDEYNVLSHQPASRDQDPQYSHIKEV